MAFPVIAGYTEGVAASSSTTVTLPAGIQAGDLIIIIYGKTGSVAPSTLSGYTRVEYIVRSTTTRTNLYYKTAAGGETTAVITQDASNQAWIALRITGASGVLSYSSENYVVNTGSNNCPAVTAPWGAGDNLVIALASCQSTSITGYPFSGGTNDQISQNACTIGLSTTETTSDTIDPGSFTYASNSNNSNSTRTLIIEPSTVADTTAPTVVSATIDATGTELTVVFDEDVVADGTGFVLSDATTATRTSGNSTDTHVFALGNVVYSGATPTLEYSSAVGDAADLSANELATFSGQAITNNSTQVLDVTAPTLSTATMTAATTLTLGFNEAVNISTATGMVLLASGGAVTVSTPTGSGTGTIALTTSRPIASTESLSFSFDAGTGDIEDLAGNALATISARLVTNNISASAGGVLLIGPGLII